MLRIVGPIFLFVAFLLASQPAFAQEDEIVRLKHASQGLVKPSDDLNAPYRNRARGNRYVPGGGLMISFDFNGDELVSLEELERGATEAFAVADANEDGALSALEQQDWAEELPTQDDTLANPVRFDPNLDRRVSLDEFSSVILQLGLAYLDQELQLIRLSDLVATARRPERPKPRRVGQTQGNRGERQRPQR